MYNIKLDKVQLFECNVKVEGSSLSKTRCQLVFEAKTGISYVIPGKLDSYGTCKADLSILKDIFKEQTEGKIKLEIISNDLLFTPWQDSYTALYENKVVIDEVKSIQRKSEVQVAPVIKENINYKKELKSFCSFLNKNKITLYNLNENTAKVTKYIQNSAIKNLSETKRSDFINAILYVLNI
jgi:hypothetical protein